MKLGWPFTFSVAISFSVGEDRFKGKSDAQYALDAALMYDQANTPSVSTAVNNAEEYLAFMNKH